jgi:signal transduction histidine kinase
VVTVVSAVLVQGSARHADRSRERERAIADVARLEAELGVSMARAGVVAAAAAEGDAAFRREAERSVDGRVVRAMALADPTGAHLRTMVGRGGVAPIVEGTDLRRLPGVQDAIAASTTTGEGRPAGVVHLGEGAAAVLAVEPVYPMGTPADVTSRRTAATAIVVAVTRLDDILHPAGARALFSGAPVQIRGPAGDLGSAVRHPVLHGTLRAGNAVWRVDVGAVAGGTPISGWVVLLGGLVLALLSYFVLRRQYVHRQEAETEADLRSDQLELIAATSSSLQQSLDLAELLPTFCVSIADQFTLRCVSVAIADDDSRLLEAFRYGDDGPAMAVHEFELRRGWRTVGRLTIQAERRLDDLACQSLQALSDLLAVAVSNAHLFQREQQAVSRLSELDTLKNAFLGTVSHELRTSTTAVQGFGELLTEHWDTLPDERRRELASRIRRQAGSLRHLVDDLLDYARLEHASLRVTPRTISLSELVSQLTDSMSPLVAGHRIQLEIEPDVTAWADPIAVERILANLLSNAGKYAPGDTTVTVGVERVGERARLRVADQGPGIPAEERRRVFVRFYRLSNAETLKTRGAGIGLSILHDFAERSDAIVTIDDATGGGALIVVDFPTDPSKTDEELAMTTEGTSDTSS